MKKQESNQAGPSPSKKAFTLGLNRPLFVKGEAIGNLVSTGMIIIGLAVVAPFWYLALLITENLYLLTHLHELNLV
jgi:hypothetical protein